MKFFNYLFAFSIVAINNSVSNRWGILWFFQLIFIAIGFGGYVAVKNVALFNSLLVVWSSLIVFLLNIESCHNENQASLIRKLMVFGAAKSSQDNESSTTAQ